MPYLSRFTLALLVLLHAGSVLENKPPNFDSEGAFYESVGYSDLGVSAYLPFMLSWNTAFKANLPESPITSQIGEWFINILYPSVSRSMAVDFGDSSRRSNGSKSVILLWDVGYRKPRYLWYLSQFNPDITTSGLLSNSPRDLLFAPTPAEISAIPSQPDLPTAKLYGDIGWTGNGVRNQKCEAPYGHLVFGSCPPFRGQS